MQTENTDIFFLKISLTVSVVLSCIASSLVHASLTSSYVLIGITRNSLCPDYSLSRWLIHLFAAWPHLCFQTIYEGNNLLLLQGSRFKVSEFIATPNKYREKCILVE
jgi:hypothetical protein